MIAPLGFYGPMISVIVIQNWIHYYVNNLNYVNDEIQNESLSHHSSSTFSTSLLSLMICLPYET